MHRAFWARMVTSFNYPSTSHASDTGAPQLGLLREQCSERAGTTYASSHSCTVHKSTYTTDRAVLYGQCLQPQAQRPGLNGTKLSLANPQQPFFGRTIPSVGSTCSSNCVATSPELTTDVGDM